MVRSTHSSTRRTAIAPVFVAAGLLALAGPAPADPGGGPSAYASCLGFEASSVSPPGSSDEYPAGMPQLVEDVHTIAAGLGVAPGAIVSFVARLHEGSHEACDEATG